MTLLPSATISAFSVSCEACSDGEEYCLSIHVDQIWPRNRAELVAQDECDPEACSGLRRESTRCE